MCGISGYLFGQTAMKLEDHDSIIGKMTDAIYSRGPDAYGVWVDSDHGIALGHRRLSIVDLSEAGSQPMISQSGRYVIAFNGEIYNYLELRKKILSLNSSCCWRGHSDTETFLAGFDLWGIEETIKRSVGMFAFAVWDRKLEVLTLGRDRLGEKPLYYGWSDHGNIGTFIFGSELKSLKAHPKFMPEIDRNSICLMMRHNYIPAPFSIYRGISKLLPGYLLSVSIANPTPNITKYWSAAATAKSGVEFGFPGSPIEAINGLQDLLGSVVKQQMVSDVPVGAFLSGGIDSSLIVALMQEQSKEVVKTFTIGFDEDGYNEANYAMAVAKHLGTEHTELYVSPRQALDLIPKLPQYYCEPFSDSSQLPTLLVSELARRHVTVALSGDGGDELFGGYSRYLVADKMWAKISTLPKGARILISRLLLGVPPKQWDSLLGSIDMLFPGSMRLQNLGDKIHKFAGVLPSDGLNELYKNLISHWGNPESIVIGGTESPLIQTLGDVHQSGLGGIQRMMLLDSMTYLPDDILVKIDRANMGYSLEGRVPFLDHRVFQYAWQLPQNLKIKNGIGKWILREILYRYVPKQLVERPKMGFGVPIGSWLRGPLRGWAEELIDEKRLLREGFFYPGPIRKKWSEHLSGRRNWQYDLWDVLMFQAWLENENS